MDKYDSNCTNLISFMPNRKITTLMQEWMLNKSAHILLYVYILVGNM